MTSSNINWNAPIGCVHDMADPYTTIVINGTTWLPYCKLCGYGPGNTNLVPATPAQNISIPINVSASGSLGGQYVIHTSPNTSPGRAYPGTNNQKKDPTQEKIDAFDRAMGIVGK